MYDWMPKVGDIVDVHFKRAKSIFGGRVMHFPQSPGEYWIIDSQDAMHFVSEYEEIVRASARRNQ